MNQRFSIFATFFLFSVFAIAQTPATPQANASVAATVSQGPPAAHVEERSVPADYVLGPGDQLSLVVPDLEDEFADKAFRVDMSGDVSLPLAGHIHAAGLTAGALEQVVKERLGRILKTPEVAITVAVFGSEPASVLGAVNKPGICQLEGRKTLFEVLSLAGGLRPDAGYIIKITRASKWGPIPLPNSAVDASGAFSVASVKVKDVLGATNPQDNILILPGDTIAVPKAGIVYAIGSVTKPGGFPIDEHGSLSALQVVSLAEGLSPMAKSSKAEILRPVPGSTARLEIPVDLKSLMLGKGADVQLQPDDILFVPNSVAKSVLNKSLAAGTTIGSGVLIFGKY